MGPAGVVARLLTDCLHVMESPPVITEAQTGVQPPAGPFGLGLHAAVRVYRLCAIDPSLVEHVGARSALFGFNRSRQDASSCSPQGVHKPTHAPPPPQVPHFRGVVRLYGQHQQQQLQQQGQQYGKHIYHSRSNRSSRSNRGHHSSRSWTALLRAASAYNTGKPGG